MYKVLDPKFHLDCMEQLWRIQSEEYTKHRQTALDCPEDIPKGCTVDVELMAEYMEKRRQLESGGANEVDLAALKSAYRELWDD